MASFAKIGSNNKVIEVLSVVNEVLHDSDGAVSYTHLTLPTIYSV